MRLEYIHIDISQKYGGLSTWVVRSDCRGVAHAVKDPAGPILSEASDWHACEKFWAMY